MDVLDRLAKSKFRSRFKLCAKKLQYIEDKELDKIRFHTCDFIIDRYALTDILRRNVIESFSGNSNIIGV